MKEQEINKTIAEYMEPNGDWNEKFIAQNLYTKSLDALVPVVEKLEFLAVDLHWAINGYTCFISNNLYNQRGVGKSPSLALATACARVIKELKQDN